MDRRIFLKFAGLAGLITGGLEKAFAAGSWQKVGVSTGSPGTWQKLTRPKAVMTSGAHSQSTSVVMSDGTVIGCGYNTYGQLANGGSGATGNRSTFVPAVGIANVVAHAVGAVHNLSVRADGAVFGVGYNGYGQLGNNVVSNTNINYVSAIGISNAVAVACGYYHSVALRSDGTVWTCGNNAMGELGNNTLTTKNTYVSAIGVSNAVAIAAAQDVTLALRADGAVFGTGYNLYGQLGVNTSGAANMSYLTFTSAIGISKAIAIATGGFHSVALRADGTVWACGYNWGSIGNNLTTSAITYVSAVGISNAIAVAAGRHHSVALRADGFVFATGYTDKGELGDNSSGTRFTYVSALGISNAIAIAAGKEHSVAIRADGTVFACGYNGYGQLGDNTTVNKLTYVSALGL